MIDLTETDVIDLSIGIEPDADSEPFPPSVDYYSHQAGAELLTENLRDLGIEDISADDFPEGIGLAWEEITAIAHTGTHLDAPWHYGPKSGDEPSKTIDEIPLEWCRGNAVVLDFTWKEPGTEITPAEIDEQLERLEHELTAGEIVLIETGADDLWGTPEYLTEFPGMGSDATKHLVEQGVNVIGTDAYGFDKPFAEMGRRFVESGDNEELWPAHFAGRDVEYCQIEKLANLDALPRRTDIFFQAFPIKITGASAGWVRAIALIEGE